MRLPLRALMLSPLLLLIAGPVAADEVFLLNGDRLTGKVVSASGGYLILKTDAAGEITIDLAKVKTFSTDVPVQLQLGGKTLVESRVAAGAEGDRAVRLHCKRVQALGERSTLAGRKLRIWAADGSEQRSDLDDGRLRHGLRQYLLSINAGARATIWKGLFADFRIEYRYDSTPDAGRKSTDTRYILGAGWTF